MLLLSKKIIIPVIILLILGLLLGVMYFKSKSSPTLDKKLIAEEMEEKSVEEQISKENTNQEPMPTKLSSVLVFDKNRGLLKLYDIKGNLVDELDLKMLDIGVDLQDEDLEEDTEKIEEKDKEVSKDEPVVVVKTLVGDETVSVEVKGSVVVVYDEEGNIAGEISLKELLGKDLLDEEKEEKTGLDKVISKSNYNLANNKLLPTPVNTTFTNFRTIKDELVFRDDKRDALIFVDVEGDKIVANLLLKGVKLQGLNSVFFTEESIFLTYNNDKRITEIPRNVALSETIDKNSIIKHELDYIPNFVYVEDGIIYYSAENVIGKINTRIDRNNITEINVGDKTIDMYVNKDFIYGINEFGKGSENSVLMKINKANLQVEGIMELKGIYSKFIGIDEDIAYIRQKNSVKKVDLKNMKSLLAFKRKEGVPILVDEEVVYILENNILKRAKIGKTIEKIDSFDVEGYNFVLR